MAASSGSGTTTVDAVDLEKRIINLCQQFPKGVTDKILQNDLPNIEAQQRVMAINRLLSRGQIDLLKQGTELLYRLKDPEAAKNVKGSDPEEKVIYQIIEKAGNKGIWIRDIRIQSNLLLTQVNKVLKNLESKKLIKAVKSVNASKKKVYMLYNLEPDRSITGGIWYSDQDFESEFVEVLNQQCYKFLQQKVANAKCNKQNTLFNENTSTASSKEIWNYINQLEISKVQLTIENIETILGTLVFDGKVKTVVLAGDSEENLKIYKAVEPLSKPPALMRSPCGFCPFFNECSPDGLISPSTCSYMKEWLEY